MVLIPFVLLVMAGVLFSIMPILPGVPFAIAAILLIPFYPPDGTADEITWTLAIATALVGLVIAVVDFAAPVLARLFERHLGKSSRAAAVGSVLGLFLGLMLSITSVCFGLTLPVLAVLPVPAMLIMPFLGAFAGEGLTAGPEGEVGKERLQRMARSALVQWLGLLTTLLLKLGYCILVLPIGIGLSIHNWP